MISLVEKSDILLKYFRENKSQRQISRETGISRVTVKKYIDEFEKKTKELNVLDKDNDQDLIMSLIEEIDLKPKYDTSSRTKIKLTDDIKSEIESLMLKNEKNKSLGRAKQLMKKIDIHEYLIEKNYDISYSTVCNYIKDTYDKKEAFIRQEYGLGEIVEFDWGEVKLTIDGKPMAFDMGLFTTAKGSFHFPKLYHNQKTENFLDMHVKFFSALEGNHREVVYDNMKQAVKTFVGKTEKEATDHLISIALYYGFKYRFCNARRGNEKGHVERGVEFVRRKIFARRTDFNSLEEANEYLIKEIMKLNSKKRHWLSNKSPSDVLNEERPHLLPFKPPYDAARRKELRVNKYSVINVDQNKYSVPDYLVGKFVKAKIYTDKIKIYYKDNLIAEHIRNYGVHEWIFDIYHFINTLKKKPGALHSSVGRHQMGPELQQIYHKYYTNNPKDFIVLLELIKEKDLKIVLNAIEQLAKIKKEIINTDNIKNIVFSKKVEGSAKESKDESIQKQSIEQISILNEMFGLNSLGGYKN